MINNIKNKLYLRSLRKNYKSCPLNLELTNKCNINCPYCITGASINKSSQGFMDFDKFVTFFELAGELYDTVTLTGVGEPTLHPRFFDFVEYLTKKNKKIILTTNGTVIKDASRLLKSNIEEIYVDVDGLTNEQHQVYRAGSSLSKVLKNIKKLTSAKKNLSADTMIYMDTLIGTHNENDLDEIVSKAKALGLDGAKNRPLINTIDADLDIEPKSEEFRSAKRENLSNCYYDDKLIGVLAWNGDVHLCCMSEMHDPVSIKLNVFKSNNVLKHLAAPSVKKYTSGVGEHEFCKKCVFITHDNRESKVVKFYPKSI